MSSPSNIKDLEEENARLREMLSSSHSENILLKNAFISLREGKAVLEKEYIDLRSGHIVLKEENLSLQDDKDRLEKEYDTIQKEKECISLELLQEKELTKFLRRSLYGRRTEKSKYSDFEVCHQMSLTFDEAEISNEVSEEEKVEGKKEGKKKVGRKPLPTTLERKDVEHKLEGKDLLCSCGETLEEIGEEVTEELDYNPATVVIRRHRRKKYACKKGCEEVVRRAPIPFKPLPKAMVSSSVLSDLLVKKYEDHLPLYRQSLILKRYGIEIPRSTLCKWFLGCAKKLSPIVDLMKEELLLRDYVCSDETGVRVLGDNNAINYMWVHLSGLRERRIVVYDYQSDRSGESGVKLLSRFKGYHQSDGYSGYSELHNRDGVIGIGCMAHARRKFMSIVKAVGTKSGVSGMIVNLMNDLYTIEREISGYDPSIIKKHRHKRSKPIIKKLKKILLEYKDRASPQSELGKAIGYCLNQWMKLISYLKDGRIRIDNNDAERAIKPFVIGRKNWLFSNSINGAKGSATIYSIIESCKANNINAYHYIKFLLDNIHNHKDNLRKIMPHNIDKNFLNIDKGRRLLN